MTPREHGTSVLLFTRSVSNMLLGGWPEDKHTFQNTPHDNHPIWVMGHVASTDYWIASQVGADIKLEESFTKLFGGKSKPSPNAKDYPSFSTMKSTYDETRAKLLDWYNTASPEQLAINLKEKTGGFTSDPVDAMFKASWHEGWHFGQVATLRRSLGLPPVLG